MEILGKEGVTRSCVNAIVRLLSFGEDITKGFLISDMDPTGQCGSHAFVLLNWVDEMFVIRSGFSSGYAGEGPAGLSKALSLLIQHDVEIDEIQVSGSDLQKLNSGRLSWEYIERMLSGKPVRPIRYDDYIRDDHREHKSLKYLYPVKIPFALIDVRIIDLALTFDKEPDLSLLSGYRRLEGLIRKRTDLAEESGSKLFAKAFMGDSSKLYWPDIDSTEAIGRANLFSAIYMGYRNRRAHKELTSPKSDNTREFLMLNELFVLEAKSVARPTSNPEYC